MKLIVPLIPLWLKKAMTERVAEVRGTREMTTNNTENRRNLL